MAARIYLIGLPRFSSYLFFVLSYFSWPLIAIIIGLSLDYNIHYPGAPSLVNLLSSKLNISNCNLDVE